ncbi:YfhD family protein [Aquibacillus albus]|uniref:YfhD family protein n=1 Tax=Aquibacillus albus TaxID=1168171 RepID=A0ABS2N531_9BACI|nr:YfhD family protein [Aquibacillus albus]MBM7573231.1 hypothetical protein [Aquibacillus albus]
MGRDEHRHRKNKTKLPQTPANQKDATGVDMDMSKDPQVEFGVNEEREDRE